MTHTFSVDANNDLFLNALGEIVIESGIKAVLQNCEHAMKTLFGECMLDIERGIPNFETVWRSRSRLPMYRAAAVLALQNVEGVLRVVSFDAVFADDALRYTATIDTIFGRGTI